MNIATMKQWNTHKAPVVMKNLAVGRFLKACSGHRAVKMVSMLNMTTPADRTKSKRLVRNINKLQTYSFSRTLWFAAKGAVMTPVMTMTKMTWYIYQKADLLRVDGAMDVSKIIKSAMIKMAARAKNTLCIVCTFLMMRCFHTLYMLLYRYES